MDMETDGMDTGSAVTSSPNMDTVASNPIQESSNTNVTETAPTNEMESEDSMHVVSDCDPRTPGDGHLAVHQPESNFVASNEENIGVNTVCPDGTSVVETCTGQITTSSTTNESSSNYEGNDKNLHQDCSLSKKANLPNESDQYVTEVNMETVVNDELRTTTVLDDGVIDELNAAAVVAETEQRESSCIHHTSADEEQTEQHQMHIQQYQQ